MSKYKPLQRHLVHLTSKRWRASFDEIEAILGFGLPRSAYKYPAWWSNDATGHSHSLSWLDAGWSTREVDIEGRKVTFCLAKQAASGFEEAGGGPRPPSALFGALVGTVRIAPDTDLTQPAGESWSAEAGRIHD